MKYELFMNDSFPFFSLTRIGFINVFLQKSLFLSWLVTVTYCIKSYININRPVSQLNSLTLYVALRVNLCQMLRLTISISGI